MPIRKKKISDLTLADSLKGLYTIGYKVVGGVKTSVKVGLEYIQVAYEDVVKATQDAISAAKTALDAASAADTSRKAIEANELERESNEDARKTSEQERAAAETQRAIAEAGRDTAEKARVTEFSKIKTDAEKATGDAIIATGKTNEAIHNAEVATDAANVATASANQAAIEANQSADTADKKALLAEQAAASANDTANHPTYIGTDHYVYKWNKVTSAYDKTDIYTKGDAFSIRKVYASVAALQSDVNNTDIAEGDFVLVNTNDVENPDNAKLYVKVKNSDGTFSYSFLVDMSGAIGFTGKTPQFSMGNISTLEAGSTATATVSEDGTDSDGNPKYRINFAIPRGNPGAPFRVAGEYETLEALQAAVPNGSGIDGFMAIGTKSPYDYYAWVNGGWVSQGQIAGGGGKMVIIPNAVINLTDQSTSVEILNAFGGKDAFVDIVESVENGAPAAVNTEDGNIVLPQIKAKANVYEIGEPGFDLTNFDFLGNSNQGTNFVEYNNKTIKTTNFGDACILLKSDVELGLNDIIKLNCVGGKQYDDGRWYFDMEIWAVYDNNRNDNLFLFDDHLGGGTQNSDFQFLLNIPAYDKGRKLLGLDFGNHSGPMDIMFTSVDGVSNHSLSFTYLNPATSKEGHKYSFFLENGVITLSKIGTGFGFADIANILYKNNATPYTPTGDYHPATKKYVDNKSYNVFDLEGFDFKTATQSKKEEFLKWVKGTNQVAHIILDATNPIDDLYIPVSNYLSYDYGLGEDVCLNFIAIETPELSIKASINIDVYNNNTGIIDLDSDVAISIKRYGVSPDYIRKYIVTSDNIKTITKKTSAEYNAITTKDANTGYFVTD